MECGLADLRDGFHDSIPARDPDSLQQYSLSVRTSLSAGSFIRRISLARSLALLANNIKVTGIALAVGALCRNIPGRYIEG